MGAPHPNDTSLGSKEKRQQTTEHYLSSNDEFQTAIVHQSRATMNENRARAVKTASATKKITMLTLVKYLKKEEGRCGSEVCIQSEKL